MMPEGMQRHNHEQQEEEQGRQHRQKRIVQLIPDTVEAFFHIMSKCVVSRWLAPKRGVFAMPTSCPRDSKSPSQAYLNRARLPAH